MLYLASFTMPYNRSKKANKSPLPPRKSIRLAANPIDSACEPTGREPPKKARHAVKKKVVHQPSDSNEEGLPECIEATPTPAPSPAPKRPAVKRAEIKKKAVHQPGNPDEEGLLECIEATPTPTPTPAPLSKRSAVKKAAIKKVAAKKRVAPSASANQAVPAKKRAAPKAPAAKKADAARKVTAARKVSAAKKHVATVMIEPDHDSLSSVGATLDPSDLVSNVRTSSPVHGVGLRLGI